MPSESARDGGCRSVQHILGLVTTFARRQDYDFTIAHIDTTNFALENMPDK
jgi:hypothetical protein